MRSGSKETFQLLMWEEALGNPTEKNRFFSGDALSPKYNCFVAHFFQCLKVEKFLAAVTVELAKDMLSSPLCQMTLMRQISGVCKWVQLHLQWDKIDLHCRR